MVKTVAYPIYQLKVTLAGVRPLVWRRLRVPSSISLKKLHQILQVVFGWTDSHLHQFEGGGQVYGTPSSEYPNTTRNETRVRLNEVLLNEKDSMDYEYDFGDGWEHKVVLAKIIPSAPGLSAPSCIAGARACPPEDCGGVGCYDKFLEAIGDPLHLNTKPGSNGSEESSIRNTSIQMRSMMSSQPGYAASKAAM